MVREIITEWTGPGSTPKLSIMYFDEGVAVGTQRTDLGALWGSLDGQLANDYSWTIRTEGRELNTATGAVTGFWSSAAAQTGVGASASEPVPDAAQLLLRWRTNTVVNGRRLQGRTFIPGLPTSAMVSGNIGTGILGLIQPMLDTFVGLPNGFIVWHRPVNGAGGTAVEVVSGSPWAEVAVQRGRRG